MTRMRHLIFVICTTALSGCAQFAVGPDLSKAPSPFGDIGSMRLSVADEPRYYLKITHSTQGDKGIYRDPTYGNLAYNADITYYAFDPFLAETNAERREYWLVGLNLSQTKDRSFYFLMRYPYGKPLRAGESRSDFEIAAVSCEVMQDGISRQLNLGSKPTPVEEETDGGPQKKSTVTDIQEVTPDPIPTLSDDPSDKGCEFNGLDELKRFAPIALKADEKKRRENLTKPENERGTNVQWTKIKAEAM